MPFPVKAIQVDGGAEFEAIFDEECRRRGIKLFILPPRSPKLNSGVERIFKKGGGVTNHMNEHIPLTNDGSMIIIW